MNIFQKAISELKWDAAWEVIKKSIEAIWASMSPGDKKYFKFRVTGVMPIDDERIFELALNKLAANPHGGVSAQVKMHERLKPPKMTAAMADYYRIIITGEADPQAKNLTVDNDRRASEAADTLLNHSNMDDRTWKAHVQVMELNKQAADTLAEKIKRYGQGAINLINQLSDSIEQDTQIVEHMKGFRSWLISDIKRKWS